VTATGSTQTKPVLEDTAPPPSARFPASWYPAPSPATVYSVDLVTGAPYTATLLTTGHYLNQATHATTAVVKSTLQARDSRGRTHDETEMQRPDGHGGIVTAHEITVHDVVSHCTFSWMEPWVAPGPPTATVTCQPRTIRYTRQNLWEDALSVPAETRQAHGSVFERLPARPCGDLTCEGFRNTKTTAVSHLTASQSAHATATPDLVPTIKVVSEVWYSTELQLMISMKIAHEGGPPSPEVPSFELVHIERHEPGAALFYPPEGYVIQPTPIPNAP
jgi:hypothetical protein